MGETTINNTSEIIDFIRKDLFPLLINELKHNYDSEINNNLMTTEQVCKMFNKNKSTIWKWTQDGILSAYKISGTIYYKKDEILANIDKNKIVTK